MYQISASHYVSANKQACTVNGAHTMTKKNQAHLLLVTETYQQTEPREMDGSEFCVDSHDQESNK